MDSSIDMYNDYIGTDWQSWEEIPVAELIESWASISGSDYHGMGIVSRQEIIRKLVVRMMEIADEHG